MAHITRIEAFLLDVPTIRSHILAMATMRSQTLCLVRVYMSDGIVGLGEATTIGGLAYGPESPESIKVTIDCYVTPLLLSVDATRPAAAMAILARTFHRGCPQAHQHQRRTWFACKFAHQRSGFSSLLIHHDDLREPRGDRVDIKNYPAAITERLIGRQRYRRDPVIGGCIFADSAFLWSDLPHIIRLDRQDRASLEFGAGEGLNEGITVPYVRLGDRMGSCTFAGTGRPERARLFLGAAQIIGVFPFQAARRLVCGKVPIVSALPRLHPRPRDCVILAGRGYSNKQIARALALTPRTVDGYLTEARRLFDAHDRTGHIEAEQLSTLSISKIRASPKTVRRTSSKIAQSVDDNFLVSIQISGDVFIRQDGRATIAPRRCRAYSLTRPYDLIFKEPIEHLVLMMPARVVRSRLRCADNLTACRVESSWASRLMLKVIESVLQTIDTVELTALPAVAASVENMVVAGLCALNDVLAESSLDPLLLRRERIRAYILDNLREPDLSVDKIAAYFGISVSSVHRAFADEPCTLMSWVWSLRLDGARREMGDPNYANLSITVVAYGWGFSDSSHFSRVFRARFGSCPGDLRGSLGELYSRSAQRFRLDVPTTMGLPKRQAHLRSGPSDQSR